MALTSGSDVVTEYIAILSVTIRTTMVLLHFWSDLIHVMGLLQLQYPSKCWYPCEFIFTLWQHYDSEYSRVGPHPSAKFCYCPQTQTCIHPPTTPVYLMQLYQPRVYVKHYCGCKKTDNDWDSIDSQKGSERHLWSWCKSFIAINKFQDVFVYIYCSCVGLLK